MTRTTDLGSDLMTHPLPTSADRPHPVFSRFYARISKRMEAEGMTPLRQELLADLAGEVVEVGAGNGMNFAHYPTTVTHVVAVEPEPYLRALATRAAKTASVPVIVQAGTADRLPLPDADIDAAVLCLVMCSLEDRPAALAELRRVLRPGGTLRFLEHTIADSPGLRVVQRVADATVWPLLAGGCHTATDPVAAITGAGFEITTCRRLRFPDNRFTQPASPHVLGAARVG
ncbi:MAG: class I SAM-dependent methyltransferase [Pseudonocardiaceae bacterium]